MIDSILKSIDNMVWNFQDFCNNELFWIKINR